MDGEKKYVRVYARTGVVNSGTILIPPSKIPPPHRAGHGYKPDEIVHGFPLFRFDRSSRPLGLISVSRFVENLKTNKRVEISQKKKTKTKK